MSPADPPQPARPERILLFIPAYNCAPQIPRVIAQLTPEVRALLSEVIIVDNRSTDGGPQAAQAALAGGSDIPVRILLNDANYGLGGSHKVAFNHALAGGFDYCIVLHGDDQGSIADLAPLLRSGAHRQADCLLGGRFMRGSRLVGYSAFRTFGNRVFNLIYAAACGHTVQDLGAGLNLYATAALASRSYLRNPDDLTFNYYMLLRSVAERWRIRFFPIEWREDDQVSNVKLVRQALRVLGAAAAYAFQRGRFLAADHAGRPDKDYTATVIFETGPATEATA
jgi:dolichol-phosphate mannosyltransferase